MLVVGICVWVGGGFVGGLVAGVQVRIRSENTSYMSWNLTGKR